MTSTRHLTLYPHLPRRMLVVRPTCLLLLITAVGFAGGCTRAHYRRQADHEVNAIIDNKALSLGEAPGGYRIDVDPRSRMFDPNNPDCPPRPPDDPVSHKLMECVDGKPGAPVWNKMATTTRVDNPTWKDFLPRDKDGNVVLDLTGAVQVALMESPNYQQQLETLYLSGLDVTFERFRFDSQFFGGSSIFHTLEGPVRADKAGGSSELVVSPSDPTNRFRVEKLTATGGELVVGLANSLVWQFAGPNNYTSTTLLDFSMVQPLLRAGGRARVLERLTIAERGLLSNVRQMEHYRRGFYLNVVTGRDPGQGPSRRGGVFGGSGLEGFSGVGVGGFGRVGGAGGAQLVQGFGFTGGAGAQAAGGYIGLLQTAQVIRNQFANIAALGDSLEQLQAANEAGRIDRFQVDLARQALYNAQSQLLNSQNIYDDGLDNFKLQFGITPSLDIKIADPMLDHFSLLDPELSALQIRVTEVLNVLREGALTDANGGGQKPVAPGNDYQSLVKRSTELRAEAAKRIAVAEEDLKRLDAALPARRSTLVRLGSRADAKQAEMDPELMNVERLNARATSIKQEYAALAQIISTVFIQIDDLTGPMQMPIDEHRAKLTKSLNLLSGNLLELSLLQARARLDTITFEPIDLTPEEGFCIASRYRRDWMNARASVVDSWRLIQFNANDLGSGLNLVFNGDIGNVGDRPFDLRPANGSMRVGLQFDAPITRLAQRNVYRQSLIEYQQAKRNYYQFRDRVQRDVRSSLRQLKLDDLNFELRRAAVHVAITQVDLARLKLSEPARPVAASLPGQPTQPGGQSQFGETLARDLVTAIIDLLNVQNDFLSVWVDHEVQQLNLDFDLGVMELDARGVRIEHNQPLRTFLTNLPCTTPCEDPDACEFLNAEMASMNPMFPSPPMPGKAGPLFPPPAPMSESDIQLLPPPAENSGEKPAGK
jgi:Outer membrane efflux protein